MPFFAPPACVRPLPAPQALAIYDRLLAEADAKAEASAAKQKGPSPWPGNDELIKVAQCCVLVAEVTAGKGDAAEAIALYRRALQLHVGPPPPPPKPPVDPGQAALDALMGKAEEEAEEEEERAWDTQTPAVRTTASTAHARACVCVRVCACTRPSCYS